MEKVDPHYKERETTLEMTAITEKTHSVVVLSLALSLTLPAHRLLWTSFDRKSAQLILSGLIFNDHCTQSVSESKFKMESHMA